MCADEFETLQRKRDTLEKLLQLHEFACADIAPPIKVLDGMPYSLTNSVSSMTENKAVKLAEIYKEMNVCLNEIKLILGDLGRIPKDNVRQMIVLRYLCGYDWTTVRDKSRSKKTPEYVRSTTRYHIIKYL